MVKPIVCALALACMAALPASTCTPTPVPPDPPPATGGQPDGTGGASGTGGVSPSTGGLPGTGGATTDPVVSFCWSLHDLGCPEGISVDQCVTETRAVLALGPRASLDLACVINAETQDAVRACESVVCGGVQ